MATVRVQGLLEKQQGIYYVVDPEQQPLGIGGMGRVLAATSVNERTGEKRPVAIKFLFEDLPPKALENARREASIQLRNDNLIEMYGFSETEDVMPDGSVVKHYHVASELLHGVSLSDVMNGKCTDKDGNTIEFAEKLHGDFKADSAHFARTIVMNVLSGLMALHDAGYVHRDIDPSNIMITDDGHIKLIDFGIAKQVKNINTNDGSVDSDGGFIGKAEYAAPELARGETRSQNQTTDIYAMGILLYQCIVGHVPFEGELEAVLEKQKNVKIDLSPIKDRELANIISIATAKKQEKRFQSAAQMRVALEGGPVPDPSRIKKIIAACAAVILLVIIGFVCFSQHQASVKREAEEAALAARNDSMRVESEKLIRKGDAEYSLGLKHEEGFDVELIDAYTSYKKAQNILNGLPDGGASNNALDKKVRDVTISLKQAKAEFDAKAAEFESDPDMAEFAAEFKTRSANIQKIMK